MKILRLISIGLVVLLSTCAQSEFAGDSGQAVRSNKPNKPVGPGTNPGTNNNPGNDDDLTTDDGGRIELVDADLTITRNGDGAHFQNCMTAHIDGQPAVDLGCNRPAPHPASYGGADPVSSVKVKLMTNTCNVLKLAMKSKRTAGGAFSSNITTSSRVFTSANRPSNGPGYVVDPIAGGFTVSANDNNDNNWRDLSLSIASPGVSKIRFTIEGTGIPCPQ